LFIEVLLTYVLIQRRILVQGDDVVCLIDTCQIKDLNRALIFQFITIHRLHATYNPWIKHTNGVNVDNYGLTLVDLKNLGHKNDPWVLTDRVIQVFYVLDLETEKHIIVSRK
jgi:hypothetical protein